MSASYTLHVAPYAAAGDPEALARATLVRDGFSFWAFVVPPLYFMAHRHWLVGVAIAVLLAAFWALVRLTGFPGGIPFALNTLLWLLVGLEASSLRRWDLARQGRPTVDVVSAANVEEAETKSFARWLTSVVPASPVRAVAVRQDVSPWRMRDEPQVIGLFPDAEPRR